MNYFFCTDPEVIIFEQQTILLANEKPNCTFCVEFDFDQYYLKEPASVRLFALVHIEKKQSGCDIFASVFHSDDKLKKNIDLIPNDSPSLKKFVNNLQLPWILLTAPLMLDPIKIPKPWGQEIWYTGMENRGQANIISQGYTVPLPWILKLIPAYLSNNLDKEIILLKTLDPFPEEVYGDLYFELHEKKQEVYIVTHVDENAWRNKIGAIRLGFDNSKRKLFISDNDFKFAYLQSVKAYERVRRKIDMLIDGEIQKNNIDINEASDISTLKKFLEKIPSDILIEEKTLRCEMDSFTALQPLMLGDVIKIPCFVPHSLLHGVRTVEFQTPVYERKILSFAQKVVTQKNWDTEDALNKCLYETPLQEGLSIISANEYVIVEKVVEFDNFYVFRINFLLDATYQLPSYDSYGLLMSIGNPCVIFHGDGNIEVKAEAALLLPHALLSDDAHNFTIKAKAGVQVLFAISRQP